MSSCSFYYIYLVWASQHFVNLSIYFIKFVILFAIISSNIFFPAHSLFFSILFFWNSNYTVAQLIFFHFSDSIISTDLSSNSLVLFFPSISILLLSLSNNLFLFKIHIVFNTRSWLFHFIASKFLLRLLFIQEKHLKKSLIIVIK